MLLLPKMSAELPYETSHELNALLRGGVEDLRQAEIKPVLPLNTDAGREDFLADVASFANASGGHLLYGATSGDQHPAGLEPQAVADALRWMEQAANAGIAPMIP